MSDHTADGPSDPQEKFSAESNQSDSTKKRPRHRGHSREIVVEPGKKVIRHVEDDGGPGASDPRTQSSKRGGGRRGTGRGRAYFQTLRQRVRRRDAAQAFQSERYRAALESGSIYTSADDPTEIVKAVIEFARAHGLDVRQYGPVERGSWFRRLKMSRQTRDKMSALADKLERAAELQYIETPKSQADERESAAVAALITSLASTQEAVIRLSSILLVKANGQIAVQKLTEAQIAFLNENPSLVKSPNMILEMLGEISRYNEQTNASRINAIDSSGDEAL